MAIVSMKPVFENWKAMLLSIAERDDIEEFVIVTFCRDQPARTARYRISDEQLAYASLLLAKEVFDDGGAVVVK